MTYEPKFQICPFRTSDGRCTHKHCDTVRIKRKRVCGYKRVEKCGLYTDWLEINKSCERVPNSLIDYNEIRAEQ